MHQIRLAWVSTRIPLGELTELTALPDPLAGLRGLYSKGRGRRGVVGEDKRDMWGKKRAGKGRKGKGRPLPKFLGPPMFTGNNASDEGSKRQTAGAKEGAARYSSAL